LQEPEKALPTDPFGMTGESEALTSDGIRTLKARKQSFEVGCLNLLILIWIWPAPQTMEFVSLNVSYVANNSELVRLFEEEGEVDGGPSGDPAYLRLSSLSWEEGLLTTYISRQRLLRH
jgi:hypothetical protein